MSTESKTGKLIKFTAKLKDGEHATWERSGNPPMKYFIFYVTFDNGDSGEAMAIKGIPSWKINETYSYNITGREYNGKTFYSIKGMKAASTSNASSYNSKTLEEWKSHSMQIAIRCTAYLYQNNRTLSLKKEHSTAITTKFYNWIIDTVGEDTSMFWRAFSVLESAVLLYTAPYYEDLSRIDQILELATDSFIKCTL